jgi:oligopeptide transport system substrate-binding protein
MKTNRFYLFLVIGIISLVGIIAVRIYYLDAQSSIDITLPTRLYPSPAIPNDTNIGGTDYSFTPGAPNRLRINLDAYPQVLDPQRAVLPKEIAFLNLMYEGLTRLDEKLNAAPAAAESWQYNQEATELTFILRAGLTYSDGSPLNAMRYAAALQRLIDPATGSELAWLVDPIRGAADWRHVDPESSGYSKGHYLSQLGIHALDEAGLPCTSTTQVNCLVLKLEFSKPAPYFHYVMGLWITYPARLDLIEEGDTNWWLKAENRSGNGAYILADLEPFVKAHFVPNPAYHGTLPVVSIEFYFISDPQTALQAYRNYRLEIIEDNLTGASLAQTTPSLENQSVIVPGACTSMITFGMLPLSEGQPSPFTDPKVRQAFVMAFDDQAWLRDVDGSESIFSGKFVPPGFPASEGVNPPYAFDPARARQSLAESSYAGSQALNELGLKLTFENTPENQVRYAWLANNYKLQLGVELELDPKTSGDYAALDAEAGFAPLLSFHGWCALYPDPQSWLADYWSAGSPFRPYTGYANPELQLILEQAEIAISPVERMDLYVQAHQLLLDDAPAIFGLVSTNRYLVKPWVKGLVTSPYDSVWPGSLFPERITIEP